MVSAIFVVAVWTSHKTGEVLLQVVGLKRPRRLAFSTVFRRRNAQSAEVGTEVTHAIGHVGSVRTDRHAVRASETVTLSFVTFLAIVRATLAKGAPDCAQPASVSGRVVEVAVGTRQHAGAVVSQKKGLSRTSSGVADLAEGGVFGADRAFLVAGIAFVVGCVLVETVRTDWDTGRSFAIQEGFESARRSALLTVCGVHIAESALVVAGVALMISHVLIVAIWTSRQTRKVDSEQESFSRTSSGVADLAESGIVRTNCALIVAGIARVVSRVLVEAIWTD